MTGFEEGDHIKVRGYEYVVERVDISPHSGDVIQYHLGSMDEASDSPPARMKPDEIEESYVFVEYHEVEDEDIEVFGDD